MATITSIVSAISAATAHRLTQVGLLVGGVGCILLIVGGLFALVRRKSPRRGGEWVLVIMGGIVIGAGFGIQLFAAHYGK